jgi:hypothetical protein
MGFVMAMTGEGFAAITFEGLPICVDTPHAREVLGERGKLYLVPLELWNEYEAACIEAKSNLTTEQIDLAPNINLTRKIV